MRLNGYSYPTPNSAERNKMFHLQTLSTRRKIYDLVLFHKLLFGHLKISNKNFLTTRTSNTRGEKNKVTFTKACKNIRNDFFINRTGSAYTDIAKRHNIPLQPKHFKKLIEKLFR